MQNNTVGEMKCTLKIRKICKHVGCTVLNTEVVIWSPFAKSNYSKL